MEQLPAAPVLLYTSDRSLECQRGGRANRVTQAIPAVAKRAAVKLHNVVGTPLILPALAVPPPFPVPPATATGTPQPRQEARVAAARLPAPASLWGSPALR